MNFYSLLKRLRIRLMKRYGLPARYVGGVPIYAQGVEDMYLIRIFGTEYRGFYVDVGANDGSFVSNTYALYKQGWRGICIEPNPEAYALLKRRRPEDICLNVAVGDTEGTVELSWNLGITEGSAVTKGSLEARRCQVELKTLANVLGGQVDRREVDVLSIDVEGMEGTVLNGMDWSIARPRIVIIEYNSEGEVDHAAFDFLFSLGYRPVLINRWNIFMSLKWSEDLLAAHRGQGWFSLDKYAL